MDSRIDRPDDLSDNSLVESIKRILRLRHRLKVWGYHLLCVDQTHCDTPFSVRKMDAISRSPKMDYPSILPFGSPEVIRRAGLIESQPQVDRYLLSLSDAHIVGTYGLVLTRYRQLLTHRIGGVERTALQIPHLVWRAFIASFGRPEKQYSVVYNTHCVNTSNYFHWVLEFLAGLQGYDVACDLEGEKIPILLQSPYMSRQRQWLDMLGYDYIEVRPEWTSHIKADKVYLASNEFSTYCNLDGATINWLRDRIIEGADDLSLAEGSLDVKLPKKIFINRKDSTKNRGIKNGCEVEALLIEQGFISLSVSDYSVEQQIALFRNADVVVSEHGAALANVIFCADCHVLEIFPCDYFNNDIAVLALNTDNIYTPIFAYDYSDPSFSNRLDLNDLSDALSSIQK